MPPDLCPCCGLPLAVNQEARPITCCPISSAIEEYQNKIWAEYHKARLIQTLDFFRWVSTGTRLSVVDGFPGKLRPCRSCLGIDPESDGQAPLADRLPQRQRMQVADVALHLITSRERAIGLTFDHYNMVRLVSHISGIFRQREGHFMNPATAAPDVLARVEPNSKGLHILIVEDNEDTANTTAMLLRHYGHEVRIASDGPAAVQARQRTACQMLCLWTSACRAWTATKWR